MNGAGGLARQAAGQVKRQLRRRVVGRLHGELPANVCGWVVSATLSLQYSLYGGPAIPILAFVWIGFVACAR